MTLDFNFKLKDLTGKEIEDSNAGKIFATVLAQATKGDSLKMFSLAMKFHSGEKIEIDLADQQMLKTFLESNEQLPVLTKAQILEKLIAAAK